MIASSITKPTKLFCAFCLLPFVFCLLLLNCSQPISPTGGKRDTIPPKLVKSIPINKLTNYKGRAVELEFDEYIVAENLQQKLSISFYERGVVSTPLF